jgi:hypothetical protein
MSDEPVPQDVQELILRHIDSVAQLEALLFFRARPGETWESGSVAKQLYAPPGEMARSLESLCSSGFLRRNSSAYLYDCSAEYQVTVDRLATAYTRYLIPITNLIHSKPRNIKAFADAFKFRKDE